MATMGIPLETERQINIEEIVEQGNPINPSRETRRQFLQNLLPRLGAIALAVYGPTPNGKSHEQPSRINSEAPVTDGESEKTEVEPKRSKIGSAITGVIFASGEITLSRPLYEKGLMGKSSDQKITPPSFFDTCVLYPFAEEMLLRLGPSIFAGPTEEVGIKWNWGLASSAVDGALHVWEHNGGIGIFVLNTLAGMLTWREMRYGGYLNAVAFHSAHSTTLLTVMHIVTEGKYLSKK